MLKRPTARFAGQGKWLLASSVALAILIAPFALASGEGSPVLGGARNPGSNASRAYTTETQMIAKNDTYGTRLSNKGTGGGAIYGCRSVVGSEPCLRATNLVLGRAFEYATSGLEAGRIEAVGGDNAKPFTTNATGVATGLNADRVDSKSADEIVASAQAQNMFAVVASSGALQSGRGATSATHVANQDGTYQVVFAADISKCAYSATETTISDAGAVGVQAVDAHTINVRTRKGGGADGSGMSDPQDRPFHLLVVC